MPDKEDDKGFAKLKHVQNLESMRHVQKLEATEMGFVVAAYGVLIASLLNVAGKDAAGFSGRWGTLVPVGALVLVMAVVLTCHFEKRKRSFYEHRCRLNKALKVLGEPCSTKVEKAGFRMRLILIWALTLTVISLAVFLTA